MSEKETNEDPFHYRVLFRPESIVPDIDLQTSSNERKGDR